MSLEAIIGLVCGGGLMALVTWWFGRRSAQRDVRPLADSARRRAMADARRREVEHVTRDRVETARSATGSDIDGAVDDFLRRTHGGDQGRGRPGPSGRR